MANTPDIAFKVFTRIHRTVFDLTKGRMAGTVSGMPVLKLATTGRKTGQRRETMITSPVHEQGRIILIASKGGAPRHPAWYLNLSANPQVTITMQGGTRQMVARTATAAEKRELWPRVVASYKGYDDYEQKTDRDIPVVILEPGGERS